MTSATEMRTAMDTKKPKLPKGITEEQLLTMYKGMALIRAYDQRQLKLQRSGRIGFCVVSTGEEAVQVATAEALRPSDWIFPYYRQHGMLLYRGASLESMANQLYGNVNDLAKGRQMPVHYTDRKHNFVSLSSVIGTHLIHAVGAAMAAKYKGDDTVMATYIGDGGTSSSDFHSALTFAGVYKAPVVIFIINNGYAISHPVSKQCAAESLHTKGEGYGVPAIKVDGNDIVAMFQAAQEAFERARSGEGPVLVECMTYRMGPHSSSDDPTRYRSQAEMDEAAAKDPLVRCREYLEKLGCWTQADDEALWAELEQKVTDETNVAEQHPEPEWADLFEDVYAELPESLKRQRDELLEKESQFPRENEGEFPL